ncbi:MAG: hypothetical protein M1456_03610 [Actinobacteria bacterium]|nr:hypothetical protein [Actinomycetota bacterium]
MLRGLSVAFAVGRLSDVQKLGVGDVPHLVSANLFGVIGTYVPPLVLLVLLVLEVANGMVVDLCRATAVVQAPVLAALT